MKGHHGVLFTPSCGSLSATAPRATKSTMMATSLRATTTTMATTTATVTAMVTARWAVLRRDATMMMMKKGDGLDNNVAMTTMATAHQAGYYAHLILNWKNMWQRRNWR